MYAYADMNMTRHLANSHRTLLPVQNGKTFPKTSLAPSAVSAKKTSQKRKKTVYGFSRTQFFVIGKECQGVAPEPLFLRFL